MDQIKTGKFIKDARKDKNLTQKELAEKLNISDKTVSKWETGNGLPEVGLMLPLCEILGVSANELLSGEKLDDACYKNKAEENLITLMKEKKNFNYLVSVCSIVLISCLIIAVFAFIILAGVLELEEWIRWLMIAGGFILLIPTIIVGCILERNIGAYECKHCGTRFVPTYKQYVFGAHVGFNRRLTCPNCGKRSYCKKVLANEDDEK